MNDLIGSFMHTRSDFMPTHFSDQPLIWTEVKPRQVGWYWMLNSHVDPGLPTIVQVERDLETDRFVALVPASRYPKVPGAVVDPQNIDALWAGPIPIPSVARDSHPAFRLGFEEGDRADIAA